MKNILIPTDFSNNSRNAIEYALNLFKNDKCTFYLLNAFHSYYNTTNSIMVPEPGEPAFDKAKESSEQELDRLKQDLQKKAKDNHRFRTISNFNTVVEAIKKSLKFHKFRLIIMGTEGKSSFENRVYGSNAIQVMEHIHTSPVLIIPHTTNFENKGKKEIVFATNYKVPYTRRAVKYLSEIATHYGAAIRILYVEEKNSLSSSQIQNKEILRAYLKNVVHSFHTLTEIKVTAGIHSFIQSRDSHMLAISNRKHGFFEGFFSKSVIEEIGYKPMVPILVLPDFPS